MRGVYQEAHELSATWVAPGGERQKPTGMQFANGTVTFENNKRTGACCRAAETWWSSQPRYTGRGLEAILLCRRMASVMSHPGVWPGSHLCFISAIPAKAGMAGVRRVVGEVKNYLPL